MSTIIKVTDLKVHYPVRKSFFEFSKARFLKAVDGVSFEVQEAEVFGIVGESGCGKSSLGKALLRLVPVLDGKIELAGQNFLSLKGEDLRKARSQIQMIFQDPYASLDPRMTIYDVLEEPLRTHRELSHEEKRKRIEKLLDRVGLPNKALGKYPHEFSGGQRQRIAIARALVLEPKIIVADEPVSSLDVSVQAQILNLLKEIQSEFKLSLIFISHNLSVVKYICDRIGVMYLGKMVENTTKQNLFTNPMHPYTQALMSAVPIPDPRKERSRKRISLIGELPSAVNPPPGCNFHTRCPIAKPNCKEVVPTLEYKTTDHSVSCIEVPIQK